MPPRLSTDAGKAPSKPDRRRAKPQVAAKAGVPQGEGAAGPGGEGAPVPARPTIARLRTAVAGCRACELWEPATQAVMGQGPATAAAMFVGEQPGDREDLEGEPFVGPAGRMLDRGLADAGIDRGEVYLTNVIKHFRYKPRGKRRIHQRPEAVHIAACRPWLQAELALVRPRVLVCLGATAAQALLGSKVRVTRDRGHPLQSDLASCTLVTVHPSSLLRAPDAAARRAAYEGFLADLKVVADLLGR